MLLIFAAQEAAKKKFWILDPLYIALGTLLAWFYGVIPIFGVAIMLLTAAVCVLRMPLVAKQVKSQREMQRIQPELKRIQAKYKDEPQKRNEEMMKLYKEHGVNPFAGCLPMVLQLPLFIVLYRLILNLSSQPPKHIPTSSRLYQDLIDANGQLQSFGMDLAQAASKVSGFGNLFPYLVLIALVVGTGLYQQRQMTARMPAGAMNTQMQLMGKVVPVFLGFFSFQVPAGVVLYFLISNLFQIGQQAVLFRRQDSAPTPTGKKKAIDTKVAGTEEPAEPAGGIAGFLNRLMKAPAADSPGIGAGEAGAGTDGAGDGAGTAIPAKAKGQPAKGQPAKGQPRPPGQSQGAKPRPAKAQPVKNRVNRSSAGQASSSGKAQASDPAKAQTSSSGKAQASDPAKAPTSSPGRSQANRPPAAKRPGAPAKPKAPSAAPAGSGGFFSRLFGGGAGAPARSDGAKGSTKPGSNGRGGSSGSSRPSGRAQPKGQSGKSKSRNSRRGR